MLQGTTPSKKTNMARHFRAPQSSQYCGWTKSISHQIETIVNHCLFAFLGESSLQAFSGGAGVRPSRQSKREHFKHRDSTTNCAGSCACSFFRCSASASPCCGSSMHQRSPHFRAAQVPRAMQAESHAMLLAGGMHKCPVHRPIGRLVDWTFYRRFVTFFFFRQAFWGLPLNSTGDNNPSEKGRPKLHAENAAGPKAQVCRRLARQW